MTGAIVRKRLLRPEEFAQHALCPWQDAKAVRAAFARARPVLDGAGRILIPSSDPHLLRCFVRLKPASEKSPVAVDVVAFEKWIEARRMGSEESVAEELTTVAPGGATRSE